MIGGGASPLVDAPRTQPGTRPRRLDDVYERITHHAVDDTAFPDRLRYPGGPFTIEAIGPLADRLGALEAPVTIVGTRRPSPEAWRHAHWLAAELAKAGATILSGGAYGIDAAAHEGALSVGGQTVALLPGSIEQWVPAGNSALFRRVRDAGALVALHDEPGKPRFHDRNAALAALSDHVVVVASGFRSGARNTAREARKRGRMLWVVPGAPWDETMQGNALELFSGALPLVSPWQIASSAGLPAGELAPPSDAVFARLWARHPFDPNPIPTAPAPDPLEARRAQAAAEPPGTSVRLDRRGASTRSATRPAVTREEGPASTLTASTPEPRRSRARGARVETVATSLPSPDERRLHEALREGPSTIDALVLRTGLPVGALRSLLLTWTVQGITREGPPGLFRLSSG